MSEIKNNDAKYACKVFQSGNEEIFLLEHIIGIRGWKHLFIQTLPLLGLGRQQRFICTGLASLVALQEVHGAVCIV